jgi:outer membrane protein OmpA-like peptidoglycan-associated protein
MRLSRLVVPILLFPLHVAAQSMDSVVVARGDIVDAQSKQPVVSRITYQSLPYGSRVGVQKGSSFSIPLFDNEHYSIVVEAEGYQQAKYLLDPADAKGSMELIEHIELQPGSGVVTEVGHPEKVIRLENLIFEQQKARINPSSYPELDELAELMQESRQMVIQLEGHTDFRGNAQLNLELSQKRVDAVRDYLTGKGVAKHRIKTKAFGGTQPLSREDTPDAHALNRRVEVRILQN